MRGPGGEDYVLFAHESGNNVDFDPLLNDQINLSNVDTGYQIPGINLWWYVAVTGATAGVGGLHVILFNAGGSLVVNNSTTIPNYTGNPTMSTLGMFYQIGEVGDGVKALAKYPRIWSAALSQAEVAAEQFSHTPVRTSNLWGAWVFNGESDINDVSGNAHHWSPSGSTGLSTDADEPPVTAPSVSNSVPGRRIYILP